MDGDTNGDRIEDLWVNPPYRRPGAPADRTIASLGFLFRGFRFNFVRIYLDANNRFRLAFPDRMPYVTCVGEECGGRIAQLHRYCHYCGHRQPVRKIRADASGQPARTKALVCPHSAAELARVEFVVLRAWHEALASGHTRPASLRNGDATR